MKVIAKQMPKARRGAGQVLRYGVFPYNDGHLSVAVNDEGLCWVGFDKNLDHARRHWPGAEFVEDKKATKPVSEAVRSGKVPALPFVLFGTEFQIKVWKELLKIRRGSVTTYQAVAKAVGKPKASRAVGSAVGANPLTIVVPCHRVINKSGHIDKYLWGGAVKRRLLEAEGCDLL